MVNNRYNKGDERILLKLLKFTHREGRYTNRYIVVSAIEIN